MTSLAPALELHELERLREQDLEEARAVQSAMLPGSALQIGKLSISHEFQPAQEVGGDFLDYFQLSDGTFGLYLGDVSGKGLPAALYAALAVGTLRGIHKTGLAPSNVLHTLNQRLLLRGVPRRYVAMQCALFDPSDGTLRISSAGMTGPIVISQNSARIVEMCGIPPGLFPGATYEDISFALNPGDSVVFCTDGITESRNIHDQDFGLQLLCSLCETSADAPQQLLGRLFSELGKFSRGVSQHDDMASVVLHFAP